MSVEQVDTTDLREPARQRIGREAEQAALGTRVGMDEVAHCRRCKTALRAGQPVTARAHRFSDELLWTVAAVYGVRCAPERIERPTVGADEVLVEAELVTVSGCDRDGRQGTWMALALPDAIAASPATEGES